MKRNNLTDGCNIQSDNLATAQRCYVLLHCSIVDCTDALLIIQMNGIMTLPPLLIVELLAIVFHCSTLFLFLGCILLCFSLSYHFTQKERDISSNVIFGLSGTNFCTEANEVIGK
mmetsp:Transcript_94517/g.216227  ORF Transcript_94517/g.216227 Transcript_94517/m.216227 type:complete len:115 (+) Transcript_94517:682-1026(+)